MADVSSINPQEPFWLILADPSHAETARALESMFIQNGDPSRFEQYSDSPREIANSLLAINPDLVKAIVVFPTAENLHRISSLVSQLMENSLLLISLPHQLLGDAAQLSGTSTWIHAYKDTESLHASLMAISGAPTRPAHPKTISQDPNPAAAPQEDFPNPEDEAWLATLAQGMRPVDAEQSVLTRPSPEIQRPGVEFSIPLRDVSTRARNIAEAENAPEMTIGHMVKAIACTPEGLAYSLLTAVLPDTSCAQLSPRGPTQGAYTDVAVSSEAFELLQNAKALARADKMDHMTTIHYMRAVMEDSGNPGYQWLKSQGVAMDDLQNSLTAAQGDEPYEKRLLQSSSRDQDTFFQCSPDEIHHWEKRLGPILDRSRGRIKGAAKEEMPFGFPAHGSVTENPERPPNPEPGIGQSSPPIAPVPPAVPEVRRINPENPDWETMEHFADLVLEGHLAVFPSETGFLVVGDATNTAVMRELIGLADTPDPTTDPHSISAPVVLIHSMGQTKNLVPLDEDLLEWLESLWPGAVTVILKRLPRALGSMGRGPTVALHMPSDPLSLAILSTVGRPLAAITAGKTLGSFKTGNEDAGDSSSNPELSVADILDGLTGQVALILDPGFPVTESPATIIDASKPPAQILYQGTTQVKLDY